MSNRSNYPYYPPLDPPLKTDFIIMLVIYKRNWQKNCLPVSEDAQVYNNILIWQQNVDTRETILSLCLFLVSASTPSNYETSKQLRYQRKSADVSVAFPLKIVFPRRKCTRKTFMFDTCWKCICFTNDQSKLINSFKKWNINV